MLYWESFGNPAPHESGLTMVCGHTPQRDGVPLSVGHAICIDTWDCGRGWLTCLDVDAGICWQSNESGATRRFLARRGTIIAGNHAVHRSTASRVYKWKINSPYPVTADVRQFIDGQAAL